MSISPSSTAAREAARLGDGTFGEQHLGEPDGLADVGLGVVSGVVSSLDSAKREVVYRLMDGSDVGLSPERALARFDDFDGPSGVDVRHEFESAVAAGRSGLARELLPQYPAGAFELVARVVESDDPDTDPVTMVGIRFPHGVTVLVEHPLDQSSTSSPTDRGVLAAVGYAEYAEMATRRALGLAEDAGMLRPLHVCGVDAPSPWCESCASMFEAPF